VEAGKGGEGAVEGAERAEEERVRMRCKNKLARAVRSR
jgi:hypothetical protein